MRTKSAKRYRTGEKALSPAETRMMLGRVDRFRDEVLLKLALALGVRRSDVVRIRWHDVDGSKKAITYRQKKKGDREHTAYVPGSIISLLKRWREISRGRYVFPGRSGHLNDKTAYNIYQRALERAGIPTPRPFHSLRATCIKNCQRAGWTPEETAAHVDDTLEVIQQHYTVPTPQERRETATTKPII